MARLGKVQYLHVELERRPWAATFTSLRQRHLIVLQVVVSFLIIACSFTMPYGNAPSAFDVSTENDPIPPPKQPVTFAPTIRQENASKKRKREDRKREDGATKSSISRKQKNDTGLTGLVCALMLTAVLTLTLRIASSQARAHRQVYSRSSVWPLLNVDFRLHD